MNRHPMAAGPEGRIALIVLLLLSCWGCVTSSRFQESEASVREIERLARQNEQDLRSLEQGSRASLDAVREDQADIKADMLGLHREVEALRGDVSTRIHTSEAGVQDRQSVEESLVLQLSHLQQETQAVQDRVGRIEDYFGIKPPARSPAAAKPPAPAAVSPAAGTAPAKAPASPAPQKLSTEEAYDVAYHLYKKGQYKAAREAFDRFLQRYPTSTLVDNALFWIGETHYQTGDYESAVLNYQRALEKYPKGSKAPAAMLKMGYALEKMGETEAAIGALERIVKTYPDAPQVKLATRKIEQLREERDEQGKGRGDEVNQPSETAKPPEAGPGAKDPS